MQQLDLVLEKRSTDTLYTALAVKLHAALMHLLPKEASNTFHTKGLRPYSLFTCEQESCIILRISSLTIQAECLLEATLDAQQFIVSGLHAPLRILEKHLYPPLSHDEMRALPVVEESRLLLASPTTYRKGMHYQNTFLFAPVFYSVADKLRLFCGIDITNEQLEALASVVYLEEYSFRSEIYHVKQGQPIPAFSGHMRLSFHGSAKQKATANLLLRYATFSGLGAKTGLGMGGILLDDGVMHAGSWTK